MRVTTLINEIDSFSDLKS